MNAYELADAIEDWDSDGQWDTPAATMLRQQADRIAELEKQSEPVAWIRSGDDQLSLVKEKDDGYMVWKPLYLAPQTKPLSNNEILEMTIWNKNLYELYVEMEKEDMIAFARAIEERHGIK